MRFQIKDEQYKLDVESKKLDLEKGYIDMAKDKEKALQDNLPFIRMMNAKVAYAKGRNQKEDKRDRTGLVDKNFVDLFSPCIKQVNSYKTLRNFKLFFEAFMGFYKVERPKD